MPARVQPLALDQQKRKALGVTSGALAADVRCANGRLEQRPPSSCTCPHEPVRLFPVEEVALVERANVHQRLAAKEQAGTCEALDILR